MLSPSNIKFLLGGRGPLPDLLLPLGKNSSFVEITVNFRNLIYKDFERRLVGSSHLQILTISYKSTEEDL